MPPVPINHSAEPIRLFRSDFLEFFTHISPVTVTVIWAPYILYMGWRSAQSGGWLALPAVLLGLFLWTFAEYTLHRFVFHYRPRSAWQERVTFLFHGVHHAQPQCKTRLVMPPAVSIPFAVLFSLAFWGIVGRGLGQPAWAFGLISGFSAGYLAYDLIHYATHHFPMRSGVWKFLKRYHMQHHYKTPNARFGVSMPVWDKVFRTYPE